MSKIWSGVLETIELVRGYENESLMIFYCREVTNGSKDKFNLIC